MWPAHPMQPRATAERQIAKTGQASAAQQAAVSRLYAALARAQNAAALGDMPAAQQQLALARSTSQGLGGRYQPIAADIGQLQRGTAITVPQLQAVLGHLGQQETSVQTGMQALNTRWGLLAGSWSGPLQWLLLVLAGGVAYLFRRAFGGRWPLFWLGLVALLLPYLLDTVVALLGGLGVRLGWAPLRSLLAFAGWNSWGWWLRGLCSLLGLGLWALHFWQVGVQFGVFRSSASRRAVISETKAGPWELD